MPIISSENISEVPTRSSPVDQTPNIIYPVSPVTSETFQELLINPTPEISNQYQVSTKNTGLTTSSNLFVTDSHLTNQENNYEQDFVVDSVTGQKYLKDRVIVRFKAQNTESSVLNEKIRMAHAKVGANVIH